MDKAKSMSMVKQTVTNYLDYNDFDKIVQKVYGQPYEIVADQELGNDSAKTFTATEGEELDKWGKSYIDKFRETGDYSWLAGTLIQDLANNGYIPFGDYIIEVSW